MPTDLQPLAAAMPIQGWSPVVGGAQRQLEQLAPLLADRGVTVTVVTRWAPGLPRRSTASGLTVRRVGDGWSSPAASARFVASGAAAIAAARPAVVHAHDLLSAALCGAAAAGALRVPLVAKVASTGPGGDLDVVRGRPGGQARLRLLLPRIAAFACVSDEVVQELLDAGVPAGRCVLIPNGVDTARLHPTEGPGARTAARVALDLPIREPLVLFCGRLRAVKRLSVLAAACAQAGARLVLVGEGPLADELAALPGTIVRGAVDDVEPYLRAADLYASASRTEGLSNAMLEALACGVPVVSVPASGVELLLGRGGGLVSADAGATSLGRCLSTLLTDDALHDRTGRAARRTVVDHHDLRGTADALTDLYLRLAPVAHRAPTKVLGARTWARSRAGTMEAESRRTS